MLKMGKKRGGQNRSKRKAESDEHNGDESEVPSTDFLIDHQYEDSNGHDRYRVIADYVRNIQPLLESMARDLEIPDRNTKSFVEQERNLLIGRILKEFKGRVSLGVGSCTFCITQETAVMRDQRGSKVMEKIVLLLRQIVEEEIANPGSQIGTSDKEEDAFTVLNALNAVKALVRCLAGDVYENCTNCYASHSAQKLFGVVPLYMSIEERITPEREESPSIDVASEVATTMETPGPTDGLSLKDTFLYFFGVLRSGVFLSFIIHLPQALWNR